MRSAQITMFMSEINYNIYYVIYLRLFGSVNYSEAKDLRASCSRQFLYDL